MYELTPKEFEVLALIAQAKSNKEIARLHFNSRRTVETHVRAILGKTNCKRRSELIVLFLTEAEKFLIASKRNKNQKIAELLTQHLPPLTIAREVETSVDYVYYVRRKIKSLV